MQRFITQSLAVALLVPAAVAIPACAANGRLNGDYELHGDRLVARFQLLNGSLRVKVIEDRKTRAKLYPDEAFWLVFRDGRVLAGSQMEMDTALTIAAIKPDASATRQSKRLAGRELCAEISTQDRSLAVHWCAIMRDGTDYLRQEVTLRAAAQPVGISEVRLFDLAAPNAHVVGNVAGSPIVDGNFFFAFEFPLAISEVIDGRASARLKRILPMEPSRPITYSSIIGVARPGQMRRDFLAYVAEQRAHPYRPFLHYDSWYDLGYFTPYNQGSALDRVNAFGRELTEKRGVKLDSFLFDDGWDNHRSLWQFNQGFPDGFTPIREAAEKLGADPGVWMSPWGGYAEPKEERIAFGKAAGYEIVDGGYALSGPKYYAAFRDVCMSMIHQYGVNQFKFDGTGNVNSVVPGSQFDSDFAGAIHLIGELRAAKQDIFINLTTGTWPSPFWLLYADSIWRGGEDDSTAGVGSYRERWITYRDAQTYRNVVEGGPLFPLDSLMLHGLIYARFHKYLDKDPGNDFRNEIRSYFGAGTQLQEMYITPSLLTQANWDDLAEAAKWARANTDVLEDTHWIGGDPAQLQVYGWASWISRKGIIVLRNPSDHAQEFALDVRQAFELPPDAPRIYRAISPWAADRMSVPLHLRAGRSQPIVLRPFQVLTLDAEPQR